MRDTVTEYVWTSPVYIEIGGTEGVEEGSEEKHHGGAGFCRIGVTVSPQTLETRAI